MYSINFNWVSNLAAMEVSVSMATSRQDIKIIKLMSNFQNLNSEEFFSLKMLERKFMKLMNIKQKT